MRSSGDRRGWRALAALCACLLATGPFAAPAHAQQARPKTLRVALTTSVDHLNPFTSTLTAGTQMGRLMYEFLTLPSATDTSPTGGLADHWQVSDDKLTWTFHIRSGLKWSDGQPVTAKDAAYTFNRIMSDDTAKAANGGYVTNFASVTAPDDSTLVIRDKAPQSTMLALDVPIVPEHVWSKVTDLSDPSTDGIAVAGVDDGPFTVFDYKQNEYVKFKANPDYFRGRARIDEIDFLFYKDSEAAVNALENGEVDLINRLTPTQFNTLKGRPGIATNAAPGRRYTDLIINPGATSDTGAPIGDGNPLLKDLRVRQAIAKAIDPQTIVDRVMGGYAQPGGGVVPAVFTTYHWDPSPAERYGPDVAGAGALLDQAGYARGPDGIRVAPGGAKLTFRLAGHGSRDYDQRTTQYIVGWLKDIGIGTQLELVSDDELNTRTSVGDYDLALSGYGTSPDPDYALSLQTCAQRPDAQGKGGSTSDFLCDPQYERLYRAQLSDFDPAKRIADVKAAQARSYAVIPDVVLDYDNVLEAYRSDNFSGFTTQPQPEGSIMEQSGYWGYYGATPASDAPAASGGGATVVWIVAGAVVVVLLAGGGVMLRRRNRTAEDRE